MNMGKRDGNSWNFYYVLADIYYFIVDSAGTIYAANMDFSNRGYNVYQIKGEIATRIGGNTGHYLNATSWVKAMALDANGNLYAGGSIDDDNGNVYVAKWDGTTWTELGGTGSGSFGAQGQIEAVAFDRNGNLFASGNLLKNSTTYIGMWNGLDHGGRWTKFLGPAEWRFSGSRWTGNDLCGCVGQYFRISGESTPVLYVTDHLPSR